MVTQRFPISPIRVPCVKKLNLTRSIVIIMKFNQLYSFEFVIRWSVE